MAAGSVLCVHSSSAIAVSTQRAPELPQTRRCVAAGLPGLGLRAKPSTGNQSNDLRSSFLQADTRLSIFREDCAMTQACLCNNATRSLFTSQSAGVEGLGAGMPTLACAAPVRSFTSPRVSLRTTPGSLVGLKGPSPSVQIASGRKSLVVMKAVATPVRTFESVPGFTQIAEPVPEDISLNDIVKSLPSEVFEINDVKAWRTVAITVASVISGYVALAIVPWYLYPLVYAYLGTAVTGLFVIGHDCGHLSFSSSRLVNDVVGTIVMAPLIYPFEPWRIKHNVHHAHTNKLVMDTAWQPFRPVIYRSAGPVWKFLMACTMGPLWFIGSVGHWLHWHFDLNKFRPQERTKVKVSLAAVGAFAAGVLLPLLVTQGPIGFIKWWFLPWLGFHFWMSTFTMVHHTAPHIPFKQSREWKAADAQLAGTVHCEYPAWIDLLCHNISVHIPHHISQRIPSYNLRDAYASLQKNFDKHLNKATFGPQLVRTIIGNCQLFDTDQKRYIKFNEAKQRNALKRAARVAAAPVEVSE